VVEVASGARTTAVTVPAGEVLHSPAWTPDGATVVYYRLAAGRTSLMISGEPLVSGAEIFPFRVSWRSAREFVYTADGGIRRRSLDGGQPQDIGFAVPVVVAAPEYRKRQRDFDSTRPRPAIGIGSPVLSPDGRQVAFRALNDIYTMRIGGRPRPLTGDRWWKQDPAWSPDGRYLSYSTDRSGTLDIWLRDLRSGQDRQLTALPDAAAPRGRTVIHAGRLWDGGSQDLRRDSTSWWRGTASSRSSHTGTIAETCRTPGWSTLGPPSSSPG